MQKLWWQWHMRKTNWLHKCKSLAFVTLAVCTPDPNYSTGPSPVSIPANCGHVQIVSMGGASGGSANGACNGAGDGANGSISFSFSR